MEFKGTGGEWYLGDECNIISRLVEERTKNHKTDYIRNHGGEIAQCWQDYHDGTILPSEECLHNALLMSRALKMLELLKDIEAHFETPREFRYDEFDLWLRCRTLIQDATNFSS